jgi:hypothetical protein
MVIVLAGEATAHIEAGNKEGISFADIMDDEIMSMTVDVLSLIDSSNTRIVVELMEDEHIYEFEILKFHSESSLRGQKRGNLTPRFQASSPRGSMMMSRRASSEDIRRKGSTKEAFQLDKRDHLSGAFSHTSIDDDSHEREDETVAPIAEPRLHASFASGDLVLGTFSESLLVSLFFNPQISVFLTSFFGALDAGSDECESTMVSSVPVQSFVAREFLNVAEEDDITFGVLFRVLLEKDLLGRETKPPGSSLRYLHDKQVPSEFGQD